VSDNDEVFSRLLDERDHADLNGFDWFPLKLDEATALAEAHEIAVLHVSALKEEVERLRARVAELVGPPPGEERA